MGETTNGVGKMRGSAMALRQTWRWSVAEMGEAAADSRNSSVGAPGTWGRGRRGTAGRGGSGHYPRDNRQALNRTTTKKMGWGKGAEGVCGGISN